MLSNMTHLLKCSLLGVPCEQAHLFGQGAATESWQEEWGKEKSLFLASLVLGTQTSEPHRLTEMAILTGA